jgi:[ribosomal protein S18]-alanine N-acetyltransferase
MLEGEFVIETTVLSDFGALRLLENECFGNDAWPWLDLVVVLALPGFLSYKAVIDDAMVGFIAGERRIMENCGWITNLCVKSAYRKQGIARALLSRCETELKMDNIRLSVRRSNEAALRLYRMAGYESYKVWRRYYADGEDALVLEKKLTF